MKIKLKKWKEQYLQVANKCKNYENEIKQLNNLIENQTLSIKSFEQSQKQLIEEKDGLKKHNENALNELKKNFGNS